MEARARLRWHRRLGVRLALLLAVLLVGSYLASEVIGFWPALGLALLIAVLAARLVTAPLTRLAAAASEPVDEDGNLPGPFDATGSTEVAVLAQSMNLMRERVDELVKGLAERDRTRTDWVAQVSHDLRTPLTALIACLDRAEMTLEREPAENRELRKLVTVARMDADRVLALADDLFVIARLDSADDLELEPVPPGELVRQAARSLEPFAASRGVQLECEVGRELPFLSADGDRLMRALENLLRNALHHAKDRVVVAATAAGENVRVEVRDDGPGFPGDGGEVDFEALKLRRSRADSAGLGLLVVRRVIRAHGGRVGGHNAPGGGAIVWFEVPGDPVLTAGAVAVRPSRRGRG